ncbi:MAG: hypothetical protein R6V58_04680 [Planctomycetota bacterium]
MAARPENRNTCTVFAPEPFRDFACARCGDCCSHPPGLEIPASKVGRLARALRDSGFRYPVRDALMRDETDPGAPATVARVGDRCVFLLDDGRCYLVSIGVPELRPLWCIGHPVRPLVTPGGITYAVSFACPQTVRMLRSRDPINIVAATVSGDPPPDAGRRFGADHRIPTRLGRPKLDWPAFRLLQGMLLAIARDWDTSLTDRLVLMPIMLAHLLDGYEGGGSDDRIRRRVSGIGRELPGLLARARAAEGDPGAHYEAMMGIFGRRIGLRTRSGVRRVAQEALRELRDRRKSSSTSELADEVRRLYAELYRPRAGRIEHILGNYVICHLFASREMLAGGVYKGVCVVHYLVALIRFLATTTAARQGTAVTADILAESIRTVERLFSRSRTAFEFLDDRAEQDRLPDPAYAATLVKIC